MTDDDVEAVATRLCAEHTGILRHCPVLWPGQCFACQETARTAIADLESRDWQQVQWQPIETAPKDGSWILLWDGYRAISGYWHVEPTVDTPDSYEPGWSDWTTDQEDVIWDAPYCGPSHWMPLPYHHGDDH